MILWLFIRKILYEQELLYDYLENQIQEELICDLYYKHIIRTRNSYTTLKKIKYKK